MRRLTLVAPLQPTRVGAASLMPTPVPPRSLVITGAEMLGVTPATALELYGKFFVSYVQKLVRGGARRAAGLCGR